MSKAVPGDPVFDSDAAKRFVGIRDLASECVNQFLGTEKALGNLSQATADDVETTLRETRLEIDKGLLVFAKRRTIRTLQGSRSVYAPLAHRLTDLEETIEAIQPTRTSPVPRPDAESSEADTEPANVPVGARDADEPEPAEVAAAPDDVPEPEAASVPEPQEDQPQVDEPDAEGEPPARAAAEQES